MPAQQPLLTIKVLTVLNHTHPTHLHPISLDLSSHAEHIGLPFFHLSHDRTVHHFNISRQPHALQIDAIENTLPDLHLHTSISTLKCPTNQSGTPTLAPTAKVLVLGSFTPSGLSSPFFLRSLPFCLFHPPISSTFDFIFFAPGDARSSITTPIIACWPPTFSLSSESSSD